jgi:hypothetical protein
MRDSVGHKAHWAFRSSAPARAAGRRLPTAGFFLEYCDDEIRLHGIRALSTAGVRLASGGGERAASARIAAVRLRTLFIMACFSLWIWRLLVLIAAGCDCHDHTTPIFGTLQRRQGVLA